MMKQIYTLFAIILVLTSCTRTDTDVQEFGYDYYPVETGLFIEYRVTEYVFDDFTQSVDTSIYLLREAIDSSFTDLEGRTVFKLKRYISIDTVQAGLDWKLTGQSWTIYKGTNQIERVEENVPFVVLNFPLRRSKTWDGNAKNDSIKQDYRVVDLDLRTQFNDSTYFSQITRINQFDNTNLIEEQFDEVVYAWGIGPVIRVNKDVSLNPENGDIISGFSKSWSYLRHGKIQ